MNKSDFEKETYFDLSSFEHVGVFDEIELVWEALPKIAAYIDKYLNSDLVKGSYDKKRKIFIGERTVIQKGVEIAGPAIIGRNCFIGHGSLIRENCLLGNNVHIGHAVEVKNSILLNNAVAAHLNYIGDSIIGNGVNISGGAMLANFRLDKNQVVVHANGKKINTGLVKFGSVIGDDSNIGVNTVLNPGTILGKKTIVYPLVSVTGLHKNNEVIR